MNRYAPHSLLVVNAALVLGLLWLWFTPHGALRNVHWQPPAALKSDFAAMLPPLPGVAPADTSQFIAMLERPLFSTTRRPPPPPPPPSSQEAAPVDNLSTARLSGVFEGPGVGGIIINIAGQDRRLRLNDVLEGWKVQAIAGRNVTFVRNGQTRELTLPRAALTTYTGLAPMPQVAPAVTQAPSTRPEAATNVNADATGAPTQQQPQSPLKATFGGSRR